MNFQLLYFAIWGAFAGGIMALDKYARGEMQHPESRGQTIALYITMLCFSSMAAIFTGLLCDEYNISDNFTYMAVGLSGIAGRDIVMAYKKKFMDKVQAKEEDTDGK